MSHLQRDQGYKFFQVFHEETKRSLAQKQTYARWFRSSLTWTWDTLNKKENLYLPGNLHKESEIEEYLYLPNEECVTSWI